MNKIKHEIENAIKRFIDKNNYQNAVHLFKTLGYKSNLQVKFADNSKDDFIDSNIDNEKQFKEKTLFDKWKEVPLLYQITQNELKISEQMEFFQVNEFNREEYLSYIFLVIELKDDHYTRGQLSTITREINKHFRMPAMILFIIEDKLTFAIINRRPNKVLKHKDVLEKVTLIKDINIKNPHRAHIEILFDLSLEKLTDKNKITNFLQLHNAWQKVLDTSELNKKFYRELANWYFRALRECRFPDEVKEKNFQEISIIRFISRILFVWFLKEKGLVPNKIFKRKFYEEELIKNDSQNSTYYKAVMQNLFFATLNCKISARSFLQKPKGFYNEQHTVYTKYRYQDYIKNPEKFLELFSKTPFLNGGLFECLDTENENNKKVCVDCFSNYPNNREKLIFPDKLFFESSEEDFQEVYNDKKKSKILVKGLFDIFQGYKFTIDENTPIEQEIALDPELLGQVLENLLASYNQETKATARKSTGSYYTPREIVNYMVDESLIAYLTDYLKKHDKNLKDMKDLDELLRLTFAYTEKSHPFNENEVETIIDSIFQLKMLDPACGSGAFPMGFLLKMVYVLERIDPYNEIWKRKLLEKIPAEMKTYVEVNTDNFSRKLGLLWNCIYGIDIQPIAIQLTKLRFFISLIAEEKVNWDDEENFRILPLPNLETKFVAANSLISIERPKKPQSDWRLNELKKEEDKLKQNRLEYFNADTREKKTNLKNNDKILRQNLSKSLKQLGYSDDTTKKIAKWNPFNVNHSAGWFDPEYMFMITNGFDIVIGNPPYVRADNPAIAEQRKLITESKQYETLWEKWDLMVPFVEKGIKLLIKNGILTYIMSNSITTSKYALKLHNWILENHFVRCVDYFENISIFDAGVIPVIMSLNNSKQQFETFRKIRTNNFSNVSKETVDYNNTRNIRERVFKKRFSSIFFPDIQVDKLGNICYLSYGLRPNSDERFWKGEFTKKDIVSKFKNTQFNKEYVEGKNIRKYHINNLSYIEWNTDRIPKKLVRPTFPELYDGGKLFLGVLTGGTYNSTGILCNHSIVVAKRFIDLRGIIARSISTSIAKNNFDFKGSKSKAMLKQKRKELEENSSNYLLKYILAIINSKYAMGYLNNFRRHRLKNYFYPDDFRKYPIPKISKENQLPFIKLVDKILIDKKAGKDTQKLEDKIDLMVYKLYELTYEEVKIIEENIDEVLTTFGINRENYKQVTLEEIARLESSRRLSG